MSRGSQPDPANGMAAALEGVLHQAVTSGVTPGGVLTIGDRGRRILLLPFGDTQADPPGAPVRGDTVYDVASLTKPVATVTVLMKLVAAGELDLERPARDVLPLREEAGGVTVRHLVGHASGYPAHVKFYDRILSGDLEAGERRREALLRMAAETPLASEPGDRAVYSDVGFILLGALLERVAGARLDELTRALVTEPLGMEATRFVDLDAPEPHRFPPGSVAPTERCPRRGLVVGEVHDDNAHAGGGVFGHAGLFSTAPDLDRYAAAMCAAWAGDASFLDPVVVRTFFSGSAAPGSSKRLGWDSPAGEPGESHAGDLWPRDGVGHLGFTGCSLWLDPPRRRWVTLLTNRVHPSREGEGIKDLRRSVMDAAARYLQVPRK